MWYAREAGRLLSALALAAIAGGCGGSGSDGAAVAASTVSASPVGSSPAVAPAAEHAAHLAPDSGDFGGYSLFHLESDYWDQRGVEAPLSRLAGKVQLLAMVYTSCTYSCPQILADLKRIESELGPEFADRVGFTLVSVDPDRDTPEQLASFAEGARLDPARWTLLSADEEALLELAAVLGIRYRQETSTEFSHTNSIAVLDAGGEVVHIERGLGETVPALVAAARAAAETLPQANR